MRPNREELKREAEAIMAAGGFHTIKVDHFGAFWRVVGTLPNLDEHVGHTANQTDTQDPRDLARRLVELAKKPVATVAPAPEPVEVVEHETIDAQVSAAEDGENAGGAHGDAQVLHAPLPEEADDREADEASTGTDLSAPVGSVGADLGADILDAEYDAATLGLPAPEPEDFAPDPIKHHEPPGAGAFIFGDSLDHDRLIRQGQIWNHADMLIDALKAHASWNESEFQAVQSHVVTNLNESGAYVGGDDGLYRRFVQLSETRAKLSYIEAHRDAQISFIRQADHQQVSEFDPTEGWP